MIEKHANTVKGERTMKQTISDNTETILSEIEKLRQSPYVKLAKSVENKALKQKLYQLRSLEKRGRKLAEELGLKVE